MGARTTKIAVTLLYFDPIREPFLAKVMNNLAGGRLSWIPLELVESPVMDDKLRNILET